VVADGSGNVVKRIEYDSFGNILSDTNSTFDVPFGFAGGLHDRDTGLVRFGFRDYDPDTARWTAKDPILFAGGNVDLYGYCLNDPINWVDSRGLIVEADAFSAATTYSVAQLYGAAGVLLGTGGAVFVFGVNIAATGTPISIVGGGIVTIVGGAIVVTGAGLFYLATIAHSAVNQQTAIDQQNIYDPCSGEGSRPMSFWGVGADLTY
jgi:RHS repeat-associated protein